MTTTKVSSVEKIFGENPHKSEKALAFIPEWLDDYGLTPAEFRVYCYVLTRAGNTGRCSEAVNQIADHCRLCRNLTLKALNTLTYVYKLLTRNKRVGETDEYSIACESEWAPPVAVEDRFKSRRMKEVEENPSLESIGSGFEELPPALEEDTNVIDLEEYQEQQDCNVEEKVTIWRRNPDATRYCQIPPIYNQVVGVEIQKQMDREGLTAQRVIERAIKLSSFPGLILSALVAVVDKMIAGYQSLEVETSVEEVGEQTTRDNGRMGNQITQTSPLDRFSINTPLINLTQGI